MELEAKKHKEDKFDSSNKYKIRIKELEKELEGIIYSIVLSIYQVYYQIYYKTLLII